MASIFSRIVTGEIPCYKVAENADFLAFLDINPLAKGHILVIPKKEVDYIFDLEDELFSRLHLFSKTISIALKKAVACNRIAVVVLGLEVPHAHIHLIPMSTEADVDFRRPKLKLAKEEMENLAQRISSFL